MKEINILDKTFVESITETNLQARIEDLGRVLTRDFQDRNPLVVGILNGSFLFVADVVRHLGFDPEIYFMRLSSYHGGTASSGQIIPSLGVTVDVAGRDVLVLEDIVDTGNTLAWIRQHFNERGAKSVSMATLLFKQEVFTGSQDPEYYCFRIPNEFVVGYGLDYAERGRNLRSIYKLKV
jgi:hypoxanthine phosphoribosyltransferase